MIGAIKVGLFKKYKIDKVKTSQAVKKFFANDFNHFLNLANKHMSDISSPIINPNKNILNHQDELMVNNPNVQAYIKAVDHIVSGCSYPSIVF